MSYQLSISRWILSLIVLCIMNICEADARQPVRFILTPTWSSQAQFAGYYVAMEKGFFKSEGLDVSIRHLKTSTKKTPVDMLQQGECNIICISLMQAIKAQDKGRKLVNILQTSQNSGLMCVSQNRLSDFLSLKGKKIGTWKTGYKEIADYAFWKSGVNVEWIPFLKGVNLFLSKAVDATLCYSYNEFIQLLMARGDIPSENIISFAQTPYNLPEEGLYVNKTFYNSHRDDLKKFANACKKGWNYCRTHKDEALQIVLRYTKKANIATNVFHQRRMLDEVLRLQQDTPSAIAHRPGDSTFTPISRAIFRKAIEMLRSTNAISNVIKYEDMFMQR